MKILTLLVVAEIVCLLEETAERSTSAQYQRMAGLTASDEDLFRKDIGFRAEPQLLN